MIAAFITDFISMLLLVSAGVLVWRQRGQFRTLIPLIPAVVFIAMGRIGDMLVERPAWLASDHFGISSHSLGLLFAVTGNISDVIGISFLIYGFIRILKFQETEEELINNLELLLPICSNCKKYRAEDGNWLPIEKYLADTGAPTITHGICPDCRDKLYGDVGRRDSLAGKK